MYGSHSCQSHVPVLQYSYCMPFETSLSLYQCTLLPICTVATAVNAMCQCCSTVTVCHSNLHCHYISAHCYQLLNCTVATVQLLYAIRILTVTISVHTVTSMYGSHSCQSRVPVLQYSYCMPFESSLSHISAHCYQLLNCTVATVQLLYAIRILTVTTSVHTVTNMYGSHSCQSHVPVLRYSYCMPFESSLSLHQCTLLPVAKLDGSHNTVTVCHSNPHCHYISAHCYQLLNCTVVTVQLLYAIRTLTVTISVHTATSC